MDMKKLAGDKAAEYVKDGMVVGLGTGSTAYHMVNAVGEMVKNGLKIQAIPTSKATEAQARELGIPLLTIDELDHVDLAIDGVDEIDPQFNAIKGGGGALYREKVVASMAKEVIWIMDESKLVDKIGAFHLPVEIAQYGSKQAMERMAAYGWNPVLRVKDGKTFVTDNGNFIADLHLGAGFDIQDVYGKLTGMLGVLEHGLFLNMCKRMIVGCSSGETATREEKTWIEPTIPNAQGAAGRTARSGDGRLCVPREGKRRGSRLSSITACCCALRCWCALCWRCCSLSCLWCGAARSMT